jgi:hypothetical protein
MEITMRTTLTLDPSLHAELEALAHRSGRSFKATVNDVIREGLRRTPARNRRPAPPTWPVYDLGKPLVDLTKANALAAELDDQGPIAKLRRGA